MGAWQRPTGRVLVVVPVYGEQEMTHALLGDLSTEATLADVVVVDNRGDYEAAGGETVLRPGSNLGWAGGTNHGTSVARQDEHLAVVWLNNDTRLSRRFVAGLLLGWRDTKADLLGPMYDCHWRHQRLVPTVPVASFRPRAAAHRAPFIDGTCMFVPATTLDTLGLLDAERFGPLGWGAEIDYCLRARAAGLTVAVTRRAYLHHERAVTAKAIFGDDKAYHAAAYPTQVEALSERWGKWELLAEIELPVSQTRRLTRSDRLPTRRSLWRRSPAMMGGPTVTVVIPTHDRVDMLGQAVASVLAEHAVPLQLIVVDDASSDATASWLARQDDPRLEHHVLSSGRGGSGARNVGLERCRTEYVLFLDDDDTLEPAAVPALLEALGRHPDAARAVGAHRVFGAGVRSRRASHPWIPMIRHTWREELAQWNMPPGAMLWRTEVVRQLGGWDESLRRAEDAELCLRSWRYPAALIPRTVMRYRYHPAQAPIARNWPLDWQARSGFVASLPEPERSEGERLLRSRELYQQALERHLERDFRAAAAGFAAMARSSPSLVLSPVSGPYLDGLLIKAAIGALVPSAAAERISTARRRRRGRVPESHRAPAARVE